jgi:hypothetical protein
MDNDDGVVLDDTVKPGNPPAPRGWPPPYNGSFAHRP